MLKILKKTHQNLSARAITNCAFMSSDAEASDIQDGLIRASEKHRWSCSSSMCNSSINEGYTDLKQPRTNQPYRLSSDIPDLSQMQVRHCYSAYPPWKVVCKGVGGGHAICQHICINVSQLLCEHWHSFKAGSSKSAVMEGKECCKDVSSLSEYYLTWKVKLKASGTLDRDHFGHFNPNTVDPSRVSSVAASIRVVFEHEVEQVEKHL